MNVRDFEYIAELGRSESILKASRNLYISQPALSKFIQKKEQEAGTPLFQHVGHRLVPTYAGEQCIRFSEEILFFHKQLENTLADIAKQEKGLIHFGLPMSRSSFFIAQLLPLFYREFPHICLNIYEDSTQNLQKKLRSGELDIIFVNVVEQYDDLTYIPVSREEMVLAASPAFDLSGKAAADASYQYPCLRPEDWKDLPFLALSEDQLSHSFADQYLGRNRITPHTVLIIRNLAQVLFSVRQGLGVTICPSMPLETDVDGRTVEYYSLYSETGPVVRQTAISFRKDAYLSVPARKLIQIMKENYGKPA